MADVKPILFSGPMVQAILREIEAPGTGKTQTRRVQKADIAAAQRVYHLNGKPVAVEHDRRWPIRTKFNIGDLLWVRETCATWEGLCEDVVYRADASENDWAALSHDARTGAPWKRRPSIHMPRWASRLTLEVTGVKVERLQDISEADALAEGVVWSDEWRAFVVPGVKHWNEDFPVLSRSTAREMYAALWDFINGLGAWSDNPWVVAVTFRPHLCNIDAFLKEKAA